MWDYELIEGGFVLRRDGQAVLQQTHEPEGRPHVPLTPARAKELAEGMIANIVIAAEAEAARG